MKFSPGDRVRVIAWCVPGVSMPGPGHVVCGAMGMVERVRTGQDTDNSDGNYKVNIHDMGTWWFRACDLVVVDSQCTCDNTAKKIPTGECIIHDRPDFDPTVEVAAKLTAMVDDLEHHNG